MQQTFDWLGEEAKMNAIATERTIIYSQTVKQCSPVFATLKSMLGDRKYFILEIPHSCSPSANKKAVLESFRQTDGKIKILVATITFGMGVDCKGVHRTIHFGSSKNIEYFIQESDRAGRDGLQSFSYVLYHGLLLTRVEKDIKNFVKPVQENC